MHAQHAHNYLEENRLRNTTSPEEALKARIGHLRFVGKKFNLLRDATLWTHMVRIGFLRYESVLDFVSPVCSSSAVVHAYGAHRERLTNTHNVLMIVWVRLVSA